jgi:hypothetical protein
MGLIQSHTAIMKGAVLHRLGLNAVKERMMRSNYGIEVNTPFISGFHPQSSRYTNARGDERCNIGLDWIAYKVRTS